MLSRWLKFTDIHAYIDQQICTNYCGSGPLEYFLIYLLFLKSITGPDDAVTRL